MTELRTQPTVIGGNKLKNDYIVTREGYSIGRIREAAERLGFNPGWTWSINPPLPIPSWGTGFAKSLDEAKAEFRLAWVRFYAELTPEMIEHWHKTVEAAKRK